MVLDPDIAALMGPPQEMPPMTVEIIPMVRLGMAANAKGLPGAEGVESADHDADGVAVRLYRPVDAGAARLPLLVFLHGGGFMLGDLETHDAVCAHLCAKAGCAVLAVDYRLAPEHVFPAGLDDCETAFAWARRNAASLGCDPDRVALGGESAGANLTAALTLRLREKGQDQPLFQLVIHPVTSMDVMLPAITEVQGPGQGPGQIEVLRAFYVGPGGDAGHPEVSPYGANSHEGLAPAIVLTAEHDMLRDDGEYYAGRLAAAGVETLVQRLHGLPHGFMFLPITLPAVESSYVLIGRLVRRYFAAA